jgi:hypothetical protein
MRYACWPSRCSSTTRYIGCSSMLPELAVRLRGKLSKRRFCQLPKPASQHVSASADPPPWSLPLGPQAAGRPAAGEAESSGRRCRAQPPRGRWQRADCGGEGDGQPGHGSGSGRHGVWGRGQPGVAGTGKILVRDIMVVAGTCFEGDEGDCLHSIVTVVGFFERTFDDGASFCKESPN